VGRQEEILKYAEVVSAEFISRPNRFNAVCLLNGEEVVTHVRNTGRCRELLVPGAHVYLERSDNPNRKTRYSLISVKKGRRLVNIDSLAPNQVLAEALGSGQVVIPNLDAQALLQREVTYLSSRFDFAYRINDRWVAFMEVKGVTLEEDGIALFPDAPTLRGVRHLEELEKLQIQGTGAHVVFVIQMDGIIRFTPNDRMHPRFGEALRSAKRSGVSISAYSCRVSEDEINLFEVVPVALDNGG
jgi:sugar fermentation stimulation protein A